MERKINLYLILIRRRLSCPTICRIRRICGMGIAVNTYIEKKKQEVVSPETVRAQYYEAVEHVSKAEARLKELLMDGKSVWFLGSGNARDEIIEKWENAGIKAEECGSAMVERYWFNLYKIFLIE